MVYKVGSWHDHVEIRVRSGVGRFLVVLNECEFTSREAIMKTKNKKCSD